MNIEKEPEPKLVGSLPDNEKEFEISVVGETTKQNFKGKFIVVCRPNMWQSAQAELMESRWREGATNLSDVISLYIKAVSQLVWRVKGAPQWWKDTNNGRELADLNVILEVFGKSISAEEEWVKKVWGEKVKGTAPDGTPLVKSTDPSVKAEDDAESK